MGFPTPLEIMKARTETLKSELLSHFNANGIYTNLKADKYLDAEIDAAVAELNAAGWSATRGRDNWIFINPPDFKTEDLISGSDKVE